MRVSTSSPTLVRQSVAASAAVAGRPRRVPAIVRTLVVTLAALVMALPAAPALAQSDAELREENATLRARVRDLEVELQAAIARIDALKEEIRQLESKAPPAVIPEGTGRIEEPPTPTVTVDPGDPSASPLALLRHVKAQHADAESGFGSYTSPRERAIYLRNLERWAMSLNRRLRAPIEWTVKLDPTRVVHTDRFVALRTTAVDPGSGDALGEPFTTTLTPTQFRRLEAAMRHGRGSTDRLVLRGLLVPQVSVNTDRDRVGGFDSPPFIGTFCEFGFTVEGSSLLPPQGEAPVDGEVPEADARESGGA